ncbi:DUF1883 domain-containing protein [Weissella minor]|uniref:DUF1883 domain-containing protein n=1 Tax=Weissella minor TaxID=1620 RepID=A0A0R2JSK0_9LACO|nr:DUF1883 domain-containing protein [Weissella minor]KRN77236.1 hypothetical protein IV67_GL000021 [Weissella minor]
MQIFQTTASSNKVIATVELPYAANVYIVDQHNLNLLQSGQRFEYRGGYFTKTPVSISSPATIGQQMFLVVDDPSGSGFNFRYSFT